MRRIIPIIACVLSIACQPIPNPDPIPEPDAGPVVCADTPAECACDNLCVLGCPECRAECVSSVEKILADRIMDFDTACVAQAPTKDAVRGCPGVTCE